jgi:hypothetical protein
LFLSSLRKLRPPLTRGTNDESGFHTEASHNSAVEFMAIIISMDSKSKRNARERTEAKRIRNLMDYIVFEWKRGLNGVGVIVS